MTQAQLFQFHTLETTPNAQWKNIKVSLDHVVTQKNQQSINLEVLFELEAMLRWCSSQVSIQSILIESTTPLFSHGLENIQNYSEEKLLKIHEKCLSIQQLILNSPQTIIVDYSDGANNIAIDLFAAADYKIARHGASFRWNYHELGLPNLGSCFLLKEFMGVSTYKNFVSTGLKANLQQLISNGFISEVYDGENRNDKQNQLIAHFHKQPSLTRIQNKLNLNQHLNYALEQTLIQERKIIKAALSSRDWQKTPENFTTTQEVQKRLRSLDL